MRLATVLLLLAFTLSISLGATVGTTGKIVGSVSDARSGEKLFGVNVIIEGSSFGAATNADGYYTILNVSPGTYTLRVSYVGYAPARIEGVRVEIDQTTTIDIKLVEATIQSQEVVIVAARPVVQRDVASSRANLNAKEIENLPVSQVSNVVGLQAGVSGLGIRGAGSDQTAFVLNGFAMRSERDNTPYSGVSMLAVQEIQVLTGGFSAEYGNARSGVVNVVTKEGSPRIYNVGFNLRYSPPAQKYFGMAPNDPNSYWMRPFLDPAVAWTGTKNGAWDQYTQDMYQQFLGGWNAVSQASLADKDPTNDLSPQAAQNLWLWQHRKNFVITRPDYTGDATIGGPVPFGEYLGNLRFFAAYRIQNTEYAIPLSRDAYQDWSTNVKLTSTIANNMKLNAEFLSGRTWAVDANQTGVYGSFVSPGGIASVMNQVSYIDCRTFSNDYWAPNQLDRTMFAAKFTHTIDQHTFYEVKLQAFTSTYNTNPGVYRDTSRVYQFGDSYYDMAPFGFFPNPGNYSATGMGGMRMAIGMSNARDTSKLTSYMLTGDFETQLDRYQNIKAGFEATYVDNHVRYGSWDLALQAGRTSSSWHTYPRRAEFYLRDKLEFEGMVADIGLRFAASTAGGEWYSYDPYTKSFTGPKSYFIDTISSIQKSPVKVVTALMPRLGIAFPITENAKFFFNYGHFRQMPTPDNLYMVRHEAVSKDIWRISNPNLPFPKTVAYELGYEHNLFDMFLLRVAGYYKDVSNESMLVEYVGYNGVPDYSVYTANAYADLRGFEATLTKNRGPWVQGFVNYTYQINTSGYFGRPSYKQNVVDQQRDELSNIQQNKPLATPYGRMNIEFFTPADLGTAWAGFRPLADWHLSVLGSFSTGGYFTWTNNSVATDVSNNIKWKNTYALDLRITKSIPVGRLNIQVYADINNALNLKQMSGYGFTDGSDYLNYMKSLHLSKDFDRFNYGNIDGSDQPGDFRDDGVAYQPLVQVANLATLQAKDPTSSTNTRPYYYVADTKSYMMWDAASTSWVAVPQAVINKVLDNKAYIHNPNQSWWTFLNPRQIFFGLRLSFDLN